MSYFTLPTVAPSALEPFPVLVLESDVSKAGRLATMAAILSSMSLPHRKPEECVHLVCALHVLAFPDSSAHMANLTAHTADLMRSKELHLQDWIGGAATNPGNPISTKLPVSGPIKMEALAVDDEVALYAGYASVIFAIARQASERGVTAALDNRPKALISRFSIPEASQAVLPGRDCGPSAAYLEQVYNAFANLPEPRNRVITYLLGLRCRPGYYSTAEEVVLTNFRLMEGAGMTHVTSILDLCQMHPWVVKVSQLQPYLLRFVRDLAKFEKVPETVRRYHRLLVPQNEYLFLSSDLRPLIAVAGSFIEEVEKNFGGYVYNRSDYQGLIDHVHSYMPLAVNATSLSGLAAALGIPDVPLPEKTKGPAATPRSIQ